MDEAPIYRALYNSQLLPRRIIHHQPYSNEAMNNAIFILVAVTSLLLVEAKTDPGLHNLMNLGQVDGKNYFYEYDVAARNWTMAGNFCQESGMELATIETQAQAEFLKSKFSTSAGGFQYHHWIAARDAHLPREFTWNTTGTVPTEITGLPWDATYVKEYQTCVVYYAYTTPKLFFYPCAGLRRGVLCQT